MSTIIFEERITIPDWIGDHDPFRRWASSDEFPEQGRYAFLDGQLWVDLTMEEIFTHNLLKAEFTAVLTPIVRRKSLGCFMTDRVLYSHADAGVSTEADGLFVSFDSLESGRAELVQKGEGFAEVVGAADIALEIVSPTSVRKDTLVLRNLYFLAGVREYWLVDARRGSVNRTACDTPRFETLHSTEAGFVPAEDDNGWLKSDVLNESFRIEVQTDRLGHPQFTLLRRK